jgi:hypothetical protein
VDLELSIDGGQNFNEIAHNYDGPAPFEWEVPWTPSDSCVIKIVAHTSGSDVFSDVSDGVFRICQEQLTDAPGSGGNPPGRERFLRQNYPNPFRTVTTIEYVLTTGAKVDVVIYDAAGRVVRRFSQGSQNAGLQVLQWDGTDARGGRAPAGVYFYQVSANGVTEAKRLVIAK